MSATTTQRCFPRSVTEAATEIREILKPSRASDGLRALEADRASRVSQSRFWIGGEVGLELFGQAYNRATLHRGNAAEADAVLNNAFRELLCLIVGQDTKPAG